MKLRAFIVNNWLSILGLFTGVIGIGLSVYYYNLSVAERVPTLVVDPVRTTIINSTLFPNSTLRVTRGDNVVVTGDVTALRVYFWNAGRQSIKPENILQPLTLSLSDVGGEILDYKILKVSRPDVVNASLSQTDKNSTKELQLRFSILEENDGVTCQIIYAGNPSAELTASGIIEGVGRISTNESVSGGRFWGELLKLLPIYVGVLVVFLVFAFSLVMLLEWAAPSPLFMKGSQKPSRLKSLVARAIPYLLFGVLGLCLFFAFFIYIPTEVARQNVTQAVPTSIQP